MNPAKSKMLGTWPMVPFSRSLRDYTAAQPKVLRREYRDRGSLAVIDQSAAPIAGYTDEMSMAYRGPLPVILFGDHTRIFKYVDFPFALGADGVKVLSANPAYEPRFLYYYLLTVNIPERGYSRHFQFLREIRFPLLPRSEQRRIVEILAQADQLRGLCADVDAKANNLLPTLFIKMFGRPSTNVDGANRVELHTLARPLSGSVFPLEEQGSSEGEVPFIKVSDMNTVGNEWFIRKSANWVDRQALRRMRVDTAPAGTTVFPKIGAALATNKKRLLTRETAYDNNVVGIVPLDSLLANYLFAFFQLFDLRTLAQSTALPFINTSDLVRVKIVRPETWQLEAFNRQFEVLVTLKDQSHIRRVHLERIFEVLLHRAFDGHLTMSWRQGRMNALRREMEEQAESPDLESS